MPLRYHFMGVLLVAVILTSCGPEYVYEKAYQIDDSGWSYDDTLVFDFEVVDTVTIYNLYLDLTYSTQYPNQNVYVRIHTSFPSGERLAEEVSLELSEKGQWQGDCNQQRCRQRIPLQTDAFFNQIGPHRFVLEQFMRRNPVTGLEQIALRIEDTGQRR